MKQKLLVIGGDSFIAGKFIEATINYYDITIITRKSTNKPNEVLIENLFDIPSKYFNDIDTIINFAAIVHQPKLKDEDLYNKVNHLLPIHLAKEAKNAGVNQFIQLSTIAVYGDVSNITNQTPENPNNLYGQSKLNADKGLLNLIDESFTISIVRPPMVYGGGLAPGNMLKFLKLIKNKFPLPFKNLNNKRNFININNLIRFLILILKTGFGGVFIPKDKDSISTEDLVKVIAEKSHIKLHLFSLPRSMLKLISRTIPETYNKLFGSLEIDYTNIGISSNYQINNISEGIFEMVKSLKENNL